LSKNGAKPAPIQHDQPWKGEGRQDNFVWSPKSGGVGAGVEKSSQGATPIAEQKNKTRGVSITARKKCGGLGGPGAENAKKGKNREEKKP